MRINSVSLRNWKNFKTLEGVGIGDRLFVIGPNAVGKSNFLDAFRFLRDVALPAGRRPSAGGLQNAVEERNGLKRVRCLNAREHPEVDLRVELEGDDTDEAWVYELAFKGEGRANNRIVVTKEQVQQNGRVILNRPDPDDAKDPDRLTQTALENVNSNTSFRALAHYLSELTYLHLVPQLLKFGDRIGGERLKHDPFGQGFLERLAATSPRTRDARLRRIQDALDKIVPQFGELRFRKDDITGKPHFEVNFKHWRPSGAWQREDQLSDGTLRLIGLLWSLLDGSSLLLLEEPELSLNEEVVAKLPELMARVQRGSKTTRQLIITTHSEALLSDASIGEDQILRLEQHGSGTRRAPLRPEERAVVAGGFPIGPTLLKGTRPAQLDLFTLDR